MQVIFICHARVNKLSDKIYSLRYPNSSLLIFIRIRQHALLAQLADLDELFYGGASNHRSSFATR